MELIVRVFRTFKGDIENGIQGIAQLAIRITWNTKRSRGHSLQRRFDQQVRLVTEAATLTETSTC